MGMGEDMKKPTTNDPTTVKKRKPKPTVPLNEKLAFTITEVTQVTSFGRTAIYDAIKEKKLIMRKHGSRTVALRADLEQFLNALPAAN
jgi:predicted DNA-binding transcriptional regulator AlpA